MFARKFSRNSFRIPSLNRKFSSCLVVGEHDSNQISPGTLSTITAASQIGGEVSVLIIGSNVKSAAQHASSIKSVTKVLTLEGPLYSHSVAEELSNVLVQLANKYTHVLAPSSNLGKNYIPRAAALLDSSPLSDIIAVQSPDTFKRPMYAGNAIATVTMSSAIKFLLVRTTAFEKAAVVDGQSAHIEALQIDPSLIQSKVSQFISETQNTSERPDLTTARVVVSGGRGLKSGENFSMLETLADKLGGAVGASRAAVDAGYAPNDYQVGQTGKAVAPDLYIAVGISGAIQHLSGMKDSKTIVAINKDKEAPIFQVADYGLVDDLFKAIPELNSKL
mmetsp:Transcript_22650/g.31042  ORF Transcript_22650/g.31042 Transcript_22650/m.31042 type:complete len:334 (-) Transcript_22650:211-1212(-)